MKNGQLENNTFLEFNENNESIATVKDFIFKFKFYTIYEIEFLVTKIILMQILNQKLFKKIYGFMMNKDNLGILEEFYENKKIDLLNYEQNSKHLIFYQTKNALESLINKLFSMEGNSDFSTEKCSEFIELLFDSYTNISFISSSNIIELIIIGQLNDIFSENNDINYESPEYIYIFDKILFILFFEYYSSIYNDGKTLVKITLKIDFSDNIIYSSYFNLQIGKYISKCLMKNYDCNKIIRDIKTKYQKLIFINESKRKYNLCIFTDIIKHTKTKFEEINNSEAKTEFEEINNRQAKAKFEKINSGVKIIYNDNIGNNLVEEDEYKRYKQQIQSNYSFYEDIDIISDELSQCKENYTIINDELSS